jgi:hypothetical protein
MSVSFHFIPHQTMRRMLEDAFELITFTESWDWLNKYPANKGFMNIESERLKYFKKVLELETNHNLVSFAIVMTHMEYIAKQGWNAYTYRFKPN